MLQLILSLQGTLGWAQPLMGSEWAAQHPHTLPYTKCWIRDRYPTESPTETENYGTLFWSRSTPLSCTNAEPRLYLSCQAASLGLEYHIPIRLEYTPNNWGFVLSSPYSTDLDGVVQLSPDSGTPFDHALGLYKGAKMTGGLGIYGQSYSVLKNENKVKLTVHENSFGVVLGLQKIGIKISVRDWIDLEECLDPSVLSQAPQLIRSIPSACKPQGPYQLERPRNSLGAGAFAGLTFEAVP
jgi:hypothetical protein